MTTEFKIEGIEELMEAFEKLGDEAIEKLSEPSTRAAEIILARARTKINNQSGDLSRGLKVTKPSKSRKNKSFIYAKVSFGKGVAYGVPLELGHRLVYFGKKTLNTVKERPFLRPAADESKEQVAQIITDAMNQIIKEWDG